MQHLSAEKKSFAARLARLRKLMAERKLDLYVVHFLQLDKELKEIDDSEMWTAGRLLRPLRPGQ